MNSELHGKSVTYHEIIHQQQGWRVALKALEENKENQKNILEEFGERFWVFSGCGTSYYLAQTASALFEWLTGIRSRAVPASEILMFPELVFNKSKDYLMIPISRSGATTETVKAARKAREELEIPTCVVSCDPDSTLSVESEYQLTFPFERERSVVMTGSFTTMLLSIIHLASVVSSKRDIESKLNRLSDISAEVMNSSEPLIREIISQYHLNNFVFLGQGPYYGLANEAALKMHEMAITISQGFHSLEFRHGPMSTVTEDTLITVLFNHPGRQFEEQLVKDLKQLGARILVIAAEKNGYNDGIADYRVGVPPDFGDILNPLLYMPVLQMLAYYKAIAKNINPDKPKNLSAVVKLEI